MAINEERKKTLWDEYKYRHEHIWKLVFQLTTAIVALSLVPYFVTADKAGFLRFIPPILSVFLVWFAYLRMNKEFVLLNEVKNEFLKRDTNTSTFQNHTQIYILLLGFGTALNIILLILSQNYEPIRSFIGISESF